MSTQKIKEGYSISKSLTESDIQAVKEAFEIGATALFIKQKEELKMLIITEVNRANAAIVKKLNRHDISIVVLWVLSLINSICLLKLIFF